MNRILEIISAIPGSGVAEDGSVENIPTWDSLKTLQIVMALDEAGYDVPLEKIAEIRSVKDILAFARKRD